MYDYRATVRRIIDGDSISLNVDMGFDTWHVGSFRLLGIAARELREPGGPEARDHLAGLLPTGAAVTIQSVRVDKYGGRYGAVVRLADGTDVAQSLVAAGYAVPWDGRGAQPQPPWPRPADVT